VLDMSVRAEFFLGVIAAATLLMALIQISVIVYGWMLARRISHLIVQIERELKPLADSLNAMARDAARATALAADRVERVDKLFGDLIARIEQFASALQSAVVTPVRDGAALMAGIRAALEVFRELTRRSGPSRTRGEEDDGLFIG
jgi:hypothetical protein